MILSLLFAATMMLADTTPAAAAAVDAAPAPGAGAAAAAPAKKPAEDRLICRSEAVTGSMFPKKTCYRASERAQQQQEQRQNLERGQREMPLPGN